ncbi:ABC transporter [Streptomyces sp. WAC 06738]|uniref:ATP-binding cassette domain-containing protein n=1 Tax=Streptomyces sp. WAC 06738 TaxID=2203210 RepID=UPI000F6BBFFE|nr:ATP-binding cassette domain-containing protein [Streptomyces sp. WAC 06738]AZM47661.1 ABC transporter [Streptomyces sp. WAC 06738]
MRITGCSYRYRRWSSFVLERLDYELKPGVTILLGPNGAGKSTLLRLAAGVALPTEGSIALDGVSSSDRSYRRSVAWMPQNVPVMAGLTAREQVAYVGWLKGMSKSSAWQSASEALSRVELSEQENMKMNRLSGGQVRRIGIASAMVHRARVLLLDEPTAGLDPAQRRQFRTHLTGLPPDVRVMMSTHDVTDLAEESDYVAVLSTGRILFEGPTSAFLAHAPSDVAPGRRAEAAYSVLTG